MVDCIKGLPKINKSHSIKLAIFLLPHWSTNLARMVVVESEAGLISVQNLIVSTI